MIEIKLKGRTYIKITLIDDEDLILISKYKWYESNGYAVSATRPIIRMQRLIMKPLKGQVVDHINGNRLDNRRKNLRICTQHQNIMNQRTQNVPKTSVYKGVSYDAINKKWIAQTKYKQKGIWIGRFKVERHAALAYDLWAKDLFGEYAKLNFE